MTAQELKNSILQLAVQGKLVPQNAEDEPAAELLKRIQTEKAIAVNAGTIKKDKKLSEITEAEIPYDIPDTWEWLRLGQLCQLLDGEKKSGEKYPYLEAKYLRGKIEGSILESGKFVKKGTRLILVDGENSGEVFFVTEDGYMGSTFKVLYIPDAIYAPYVLNFLLLKKQLFRNRKTGAAIPHLNKELFFDLLIPIPPLAEQERIVAKIEELLPLIEEYDEAEQRLSTLNDTFPEMLRKSILQQAVQGKLTERDPSDEPASELLKRIQAEKAKLIAEGKIKKEKTLPPIMDEEKPFDIPDTWVWAPMGVIYNIHSSKRIHAKEYTSEGIPFFRSLEVVSLAKGVEPSVSFYISKTRYDEICQDNIMPKNGDLLIACIGGSIGWNWVVDDRIFYYKDGNVVAFDGHSDFDIEYLRLYLSSPAFLQQIFDDVSGTAYKALTIEMLKGHYIPVPPLAEQKRIVERVNELLAVCDGLK